MTVNDVIMKMNKEANYNGLLLNFREIIQNCWQI